MTKHLLFQKLIEHHRFNEPNLQKEISSICEYQQLTHGTSLICENQFIKWFVIILDGQVRVWQGNHEHEVTLYYLKKYETCAYSVVALDKQYQSFVNATVSSKKATILKIPTSNMKLWKKYSSWNTFINSTLVEKYEIMKKLSSIFLASICMVFLASCSFFSDHSESCNSEQIKINEEMKKKLTY